ncbi:substrate-binding domain-containing protein [Maribacter algarum]|uniref:Substrate-binding domain-containing protein n=1 Tax=Maribacter algarum (ex Zhang et al. 2020) TaxID=2578118 RepID=A0A5S3PS18_9FLAO|nr:LacI family DNA-binding transcriptional regulator [Maribacter algarum]TMM57530.1 substrate-binding domain-containing protein [Maribacter algarum]
MDKKYTIKDIAELAGVSKGTVDRVLHRRGKVSPKALARVEKILKEIDYQPNPIARNLKNNKVYRICVLMPDPKEDAYWSPAVQGIKEAAREFKPFGVLVNTYYYYTSEKISFIEKSKEALNSSPDVLLMAPVFQKEALEIFKHCQEAGVSVALFNNLIEEFSTQSFVGQDLTQTGRVAAGLIHKLVDNSSTIAILHIDEEKHMSLKENGFKAFFEGRSFTPEIKTFSLQTSNYEAFKKQSIDLVKNTNTISSVFVTNSKAYVFLKAISGINKNLTIVGYDLLPENIKYLEKGHIDFLIHQKPKRQAYLGVGYLAENFLFGKPIPEENLLPIDIITPENVMYYLD